METLLKDLIWTASWKINVAALPNRFEDNEISKKIAYNEHRLIDVTRDFTDESEKDVEYATGAKDVEDEHYGWACAITSQEISYAYGPGPGKDMPPSAEELPARAEEDLLLTMIVIYQKYTCMIFNEKIHAGISCIRAYGLNTQLHIKSACSFHDPTDQKLRIFCGVDDACVLQLSSVMTPGQFIRTSQFP